MKGNADFPQGFVSFVLSAHIWAMKKKGPNGCLGESVGDEILASYVGIIVNHYKDLH